MNLALTEEMARMKADSEMRRLAQDLGMPVGLPQSYYTIPVKKDGRVTHYEGRWGKNGLLWIAHQIGRLVYIECRNTERSNKNNGLATAFCKLVYQEGWVSIEEGEAHISEKNIQNNPGGPYKQADNMARVRALEHAIVNISAYGSIMANRDSRLIDQPVICEVVKNADN